MATGKAKGVKKAVNVAKKTAVKTAKTAAANPQVTLYVLGGIAVLTGIWYLSKSLKKTAKVLSGEGIQANIDIGDNLQVNPAKTTITADQARVYASQLLTAMNWQKRLYIPFGTVIYGTDNDTVLAIFNKITSEDFKLIYRAFGKKHYDGKGSPPENIIGGVEDFIGWAKERDLVYWLRAEINKTFDRTLFGKVKEIVEGAGFVFE